MGWLIHGKVKCMGVEGLKRLTREKVEEGFLAVVADTATFCSFVVSTGLNVEGVECVIHPLMPWALLAFIPRSEDLCYFLGWKVEDWESVKAILLEGKGDTIKVVGVAVKDVEALSDAIAVQLEMMVRRWILDKQAGVIG